MKCEMTNEVQEATKNHPPSLACLSLACLSLACLSLACLSLACELGESTVLVVQ